MSTENNMTDYDLLIQGERYRKRDHGWENDRGTDGVRWYSCAATIDGLLDVISQMRGALSKIANFSKLDMFASGSCPESMCLLINEEAMDALFLVAHPPAAMNPINRPPHSASSMH